MISIRRWPARLRTTLLLAWWLVMGLLAMTLPRFAQPAEYHAFVDGRTRLGVPHFGDVVSNGAFLGVGLVGLWLLASGRVRAAFATPWRARPYAAFFLSLVLVAFGSAYYHWAPSDASLFWDRIAMTAAFMSLAAMVIADRVHPRWGVRRGLPLLVALGVGATIAWRVTGDVTFYFLVAQLAPIGSLVLTVFVLFPQRRVTDARHLVGLAGFYALAVIFEQLDASIWALSAGTISGHTLKHLAAACGVGLVIPMLVSAARRSRRRADPSLGCDGPPLHGRSRFGIAIRGPSRRIAIGHLGSFHDVPNRSLFHAPGPLARRLR